MAANARKGRGRCLMLGGVVAVVGLVAAVQAPVASAACTVFSGGVFEGGPESEVICGTSGNDTLNGNGGNDEIHGLDGNDHLNGGPGNDFIDGSRGGDTITGGEGEDKLIGGSGADVMDGGPGSDRLDGGEGSDTLTGGEGQDEFNAGDGNDVIHMRDGIGEHVFCAAGTDTVDMDLKDNEVLFADNFSDFVYGYVLGQQCENVTVGAVLEGPNVVLPGGRLKVSVGGRAQIRLRCPASLDIPCAGTLTLGVVEKTKKKRSRPAVGYSLAPGASRSVTAHLSRHDNGSLRRRRNAPGAILSVEKGHFGNKTTFKTVGLIERR
jgi:RTX calcium-binding nonapeptide repeat (4 copies)